MTHKISDALTSRISNIIERCMHEIRVAEMLPPIFAEEVSNRNTGIIYALIQLTESAKVRNEVMAHIKDSDPSMHKYLMSMVRQYDEYNQHELSTEMQGDVHCVSEATQALNKIFSK